MIKYNFTDLEYLFFIPNEILLIANFEVIEILKVRNWPKNDFSNIM